MGALDRGETNSRETAVLTEIAKKRVFLSVASILRCVSSATALRRSFYRDAFFFLSFQICSSKKHLLRRSSKIKSVLQQHFNLLKIRTLGAEMGGKKEKREELSGRNYDASLNRNTKKESQKTILPVFFFSLFLPTGNLNSR